MKKEINLDKISFVIGDKVITKIVVSRLYFVALLNIVKEANKKAETNDDVQREVEMLRFVRQVEYYAGTEIVTPDPIALREMPIPLARKIRAEFADATSKGGKLISGDGISIPAIYELGTPIPTDKGEIKELEFMATTLGDIENVIYRTNTHDQTLALLSSVATPLGTETTLQALPSWALDLITIADAVVIGEKIVPLFVD